MQPQQKVYLPALEPLLKGETTLLPWKLVGLALADSTDKRQECLESFLDDSYVQSLFDEPAKAFAPPSAQSKASFESLTSPVQIAPTPNSLYDMEQIKADAKWLSENVKLNEEAALRIVLIEIKSRANKQLRAPLSIQDLRNLADAAGVSDGQLLTTLPTFDINTSLAADALWVEFDRPESRKRRLLQIFMDERRYFSMTANFALSKKLRGRSSTAPCEPATAAQRKQQQLQPMSNKKIPETAKYQERLPQYLKLVCDTMDDAQCTLKSVVKEPNLSNEELEREWLTSHLAVGVHALAVVFQILDMRGCDYAPGDVVLAWFDFVGQFGFFDNLPDLGGDLTHYLAAFRCYIAVITLKIINLPESLAVLVGESTSDDEVDPYVFDSEILSRIHDVLSVAADAGSTTASPAIFAWSILTHQMFTSHQSRLEKRDHVQQQRAVTRFEQNLDYDPPSRLTRRTSDASIVSVEPAAYDSFLTVAQLTHDFQAMQQRALAALGGGALFDYLTTIATDLGDSLDGMFAPVMGSRMRLVLLRFLDCTYSYVAYSTESISALLAVLSGNKAYWDIAKVDRLDAETDVLAHALRDEVFVEQYLDQSLNRYPAEFMPFVEFCKALAGCFTLPPGSQEAELLSRRLSKTPSLTFTMPDDFQSYELAMDDENANAFILYEDLNLFPDNSIAWGRRSAPTVDFVIPAETRGRFISDAGRVVQVDYTHSALALLGRRLEVHVHERRAWPVLGQLSTNELAGAISLLAVVMHTTMEKTTRRGLKAPWEQGEELLDDICSGLTRQRDIIAIICEVLDSYLQAEVSDTEEDSITVVTACVQFLHSVLPVAPGRVWSYMARCELLNTPTKAGRLSRITANLDMVAVRFDLITSSLQLMSDMVENAMTSSVIRKAGTKFKMPVEELWAGTSDKLLARVCLSLSQTSVDIFENSATWRFETEIHRTVVMKNVVPILRRMIKYAFEVGDGKPPSALTACLYPAAVYVTDCFLAPSAAALRFQPLLGTLMISYQLPDTSLYPWRLQANTERLISALEFATTLVSVSHVIEERPAHIETQLFKSASLLARLCAVSSDFRRPSLRLLETLVLNASARPGEPPSLLGYLGAQVSGSFLCLLSKLDQPFNQTDEVCRIWCFFTSILKHRQQWMANCIISGTMPRTTIRTKSGKKSDDSSMEKNGKKEPGFVSALDLAVSRLQSLNTIPSTEALALLEFLAAAINYYPFTVIKISKHVKLLDTLRAYINTLPAAHTAARTDQKLLTHQARIAATIAEFFAMMLYHMRQLGDADSLAEHLLDDIDYYLRYGVDTTSYNISLHSNLERNFKAQYPGYILTNFVRTTVDSTEQSTGSYYALEYADAMLKFDPSWVGKKNNGFRSEMERANTNLSLLAAQGTRFHAWGYLLVELANCLQRRNQRVLTIMLQVAKECLEANASTTGPMSYIANLAQSRATFCLILTQRAVTHRARFPELAEHFAAVWEAVDAVCAEEGPTITEAISPYYRTLLKILYITLRACSHGLASQDEGGKNAGVTNNANSIKRGINFEQSALNIIDKVVGVNFRNLATLVHDTNVSTQPGDMALLTAILQTCLTVPSMEDSQPLILNILASHDIFKVAAALYSWSDSIATLERPAANYSSQEKHNGDSTRQMHGRSVAFTASASVDPVYGELSLLLIREVSAMPYLAEAMAAAGLLTQITRANLTNYIRGRHVGPLSESVAAQRCYSVWVRCILPILINLLSAVGRPIAVEVATVLNMFPVLLQQSLRRLEPPGLSRMSTDADTSASQIAGSVPPTPIATSGVTSLLSVPAGNNRFASPFSGPAASRAPASTKTIAPPAALSQAEPDPDPIASLFGGISSPSSSFPSHSTSVPLSGAPPKQSNATETATARDKRTTGHLTLLSLNEIRQLALLVTELSVLREQSLAIGGGFGSGNGDNGSIGGTNTADGLVPEVAWDVRAAEELVDLWLGGSRRLLRDRIVALDAREVEWLNQPPRKVAGSGSGEVDDTSNGEAADKTTTAAAAKAKMTAAAGNKEGEELPGLQACESRLEQMVIEELLEVRALLKRAVVVE